MMAGRQPLAQSQSDVQSAARGSGRAGTSPTWRLDAAVAAVIAYGRAAWHAAHARPVEPLVAWV
jgi:hypothetical protein